MIISDDNAIIAADKFINYFKNFSNLEDYLRHVKKSVITYSNELGEPTDDFFNMDIHPEEMDFDIRLVGDRFKSIPQDYYKKMLRIVSSHNNEDNIPGRIEVGGI